MRVFFCKYVIRIFKTITQFSLTFQFDLDQWVLVEAGGSLGLRRFLVWLLGSKLTCQRGELLLELLNPGQGDLCLVDGRRRERRSLELGRGRGRGEEARVGSHGCLVSQGHAPLFHGMCLCVLRTTLYHFLFDEKVKDQADHQDGEGSRGQDN